MTDQLPFKKRNKSKIGLKPGQDFYAPGRKAADFPAVGMTLRTYNQNGSKSGPSFSPKDSVKPPKNKKRFFRPKRIILTLLIIILAGGGYFGFNFAYNIHKLFGGSILDIFHSATLKGESSGRINILLAGNSADDPGHDGADLTDSIMLISIDTKNNSAFLLSIPRDLWVDIPNYGYQKINDTYVVGQNNNFSAAGYPNGGMGQLEQLVTQDFGVPIDYYALINYEGIKDAVNAVGGINVNIQSSDPRGLYDPSIDYSTGGPLVKLTNGEHTLDGEQALDLARARGDAYGSYGFINSDFERTANQRLMLVALKQKATSLGTLSDPLTLSKLFNSVGTNVKTDLSLSDAKALYGLVKPINNLKSLSLQSVNGQSLVASYITSSGQDALIPTAGIGNYSQIEQYLNQLTSSNPAVREGAPIVVLNGTNDSGLAGRVQTSLESKGFDVSAIGDASPITTTQIINNSAGKYPNTESYLKSVYGNNLTTTNPYGYSGSAFIVVLGQDQANKDPTYLSQQQSDTSN